MIATTLDARSIQMEHRHIQNKLRMEWDSITYRCLLIGLSFAKTEEAKREAIKRIIDFNEKTTA